MMRPPRYRAIRPLLAGCALLLLPTTSASQSFTLDDAVRAALATHPAMERADALVDVAREGAATAEAARWPSLGFEVGLDRFEEPMVTTPIHGFDPTLLPRFDRTLVQGSLAARYTLLDWGERSSALEAARDEIGAASAARRTTRSEVIVRVAEAYLNLVSARSVDAAAQARVEALEAEEARARRGVEAGTSAEVELLRASVAVQDAAAERIDAEGRVRLAERELARLTGWTPDEMEAVGTTDVRFEAPSGSGDHPLVERAARRADATRARLDAHESVRLPRLDLTGALLDYGTPSQRHVLEWRAGVRVMWSVFDGGARSARIGAARAEQRAAQSDVAAARLQVEAASDEAATQVRSADARVEALESSVAQWEELVRIENLALEAGSGLQRDLLEAQSGRFRAQAALVHAQAVAVLARIRLAAARGVLDQMWIDENTGGDR